METKKRLVMTFLTGVQRKTSIIIDDPKEDITEAEIVAAMNLIVEKNIFAPYGSNLIATVEAKIVVTDTSEYDLVVA
ncbi:MAG: DUF2922 domain-containing protein [Paraclostridium sordellii]|uniref:DUF2922 domain-containing protein n=1 Tax=Paraclostridium sordellii TaxID=1505 RepID=UPI000385706D|nr:MULTISPECIES: DUF2922 domain-containing protein [Paeniclostridium]MDU5021935.1 DUF2922 domain-containing protein [Clostridiales bacterium]AUN14313.1 hypothetical protein RSJ16_08800 [Paeniclostridium sordellii]EPZ56161.1 hypothetical protein H476_2763 [[Clostridium] sordellii VPI 9048] [Paeniclostridium sordellii VPI 9048]MBS6025128.1 DUF2922 domain-containing protein [Paeniclostridium sordellii]MBW4863046.1 DUF2922 domain-containing protein [Paeniclostridium sp.]